MRESNMKNPSRKRNEFDTPVQSDVKWVGMRGVTEKRGKERRGWKRECMAPCVCPLACMAVYE
jgi:hypothetical protein